MEIRCRELQTELAHEKMGTDLHPERKEIEHHDMKRFAMRAPVFIDLPNCYLSKAFIFKASLYQYILNSISAFSTSACPQSKISELSIGSNYISPSAD
jgi:hypothetical protein